VPIFNIPYSPDFNGIESFFSLVKAEYKALLLNKLMEEEEIDAADLITKSLSKIDRNHIKACIRKGFEELEKKFKTVNS